MIATPMTAAGRDVMKKISRDSPAWLAMKAFCGFPKTVEALPILADVAIPSKRGEISCADLFCFECSLNSSGVSTTHVASFVRIADMTADSTQTFQRTHLNLSPLLRTHTATQSRRPSRR